MFNNGISGRWTLGVVVLVPIIAYNEVGGLTTIVGSILAGLFSVFSGKILILYLKHALEISKMYYEELSK